jgi:hypothetical protein
MEASMLDTPEERIKAAGDRKSRVIQAFIHEFGNITRQEACDAVGIRSAQLYRDAHKYGIVLRKGCRPVLTNGEAIAKSRCAS